MRAISLWQPWASSIALGAKTIETRHWSTDYRGPLAIHAAKKWNGDLDALVHSGLWKGALWPLTTGGTWIAQPRTVLPFGAVVCICNLVDCVPVETLSHLPQAIRFPALWTFNLARRFSWIERDMGDYSPGRFAWILKDIRPLKTPLPWKGGQSFFTVPDELLRSKQ